MDGKKIVVPSEEKSFPKVLFVPSMVVPATALNSFLVRYGKNLLGFLPAYTDENVAKQFNAPFLTIKSNFVEEKKIKIPGQGTVVDRIKQIEKEIKQHEDA